ncbi:MAG TPA: LamG-like jellyroll fold domain-containing protein [Verrucomicrobiae bacterium]|jgi:hypothetical protein|nr:LamG-like jellyroll fold domain-containing protein [Verrucomicrobiae bacterium]
MKANTFYSLIVPTVFLSATVVLQAQSTISNAVTSLNPVGYWPMHEVEVAAPGDIETNYGTLGVSGTGYYPDWAGAKAWFKRGVRGALANDTDQAVYFTWGGEPASGTYTNTLLIPHNSSQATLNPPFSVECWVYPTNQNNQSIWSSSGYEGQNAGAFGGGNGRVGGMTLQWNGTNTGFQVYNYFNNTTLNTEGFSGNTNNPNNTPLNQWYHVVVTCDANTNIDFFVDGIEGLYVPANGGTSGGLMTSVPAVGLYTPDNWSPFQVGGGRGDTRSFPGYLDEFAIYTNVLGDASTHYSDGISGAAGQYFHDVTNDHPVVYLRMDAAAAYSAPPAGTWPTLMNYGMTNGVAVGNGVYTPGTFPGQMISQLLNPNGVPFGGVPTNMAVLSGVSSFGDAGYAAAYNPTGAVPFSVTALFRGNPCDGRNQTIVGHSDNSWNIILNTSGKLVAHFGTNNSGAVTSTGVYNDGLWHQVVEVYAPSSTPGVPGTNALFVDSELDNASVAVTPDGLLPGSSSDLMIGDDPQYTNNPAGAGRSFAGQISDVAMFNYALSPAQVQTLYSGCAVAPYITSQPATGRAANGGTGTFIYFGVLANGSQPLAYQWYFNTVLNYSGATLLTDGVKYSQSQTLQVTVTNLAPTDDGFYYAVITNNSGSVTTRLASLTVFAAPTIVTQSPVPYTNLFSVFAGTSPTYSILASGAQPISYFWYTNGVLDGAATSSSLTIANMQLGSFITNYCIMTNVAGSATSMVWTATAISDPTAPYPASVLALGPLDYWRLNEPETGNGNAGVLAVDYAGGNNGIYTNVYLGNSGYSFTTDPSDVSAEFGEYGSFPAVNNDAGQIQGVNFAVTNGGNGEFTVEAWVNAVDLPSQFPQITGAPILTKGTFNHDDQFNLGIDSTKLHFRFYVRNAAGTVYICGSGSAPAIDNAWHHVAGVCDEANGQLLEYYDGKLVNTSAIPTNSGIYADSEPATIGAGTVDGVNYTNQLIGNLNDVAVFGYALSPGQIATEYSSSGAGPTFVQVPVTNITVNGGGTLTIPASLIGTTPLNYQWSDVSSGTNIVLGTTNEVPLNATLMVSDVPGGWNNDQLELSVNNSYGSTNVFVLLTVLTNGPIITQDIPTHIGLLPGTMFNYSVAVAGPPPYSYQWYQDGGSIPNQTNSNYTATAGSAGTSSSYFVVITNLFGSTTSSVSAFASLVQLTTPYATNILQFHPVGYWPLQETNAPAVVSMETNFGSLGKLGNAYYAATNAANVAYGLAGAIAGDSDTAVAFSGGAGNDDSYAFVPRVSPSLTIAAPYTLECWVNAAKTAYGVVLGEGGGTGLDGGANFGGFQMGMGVSGGNNSFQMNYYTGAGNAQNQEIEANLLFVTNQWYHYVITYDGTNSILYVDGANIFTATSSYAVDTWSPLAIGAGKWGGGPIGGIRWWQGQEDEVAIYTNVLTEDQIGNHYLAGTTAGSNYMQTVLGDDPLLYYRMDRAGYTNQNPVDCPIAPNFGSAPMDAVYLSGTVPGEFSGPSGLGTNAVAVGLNGVFSCVNAGSDSTFNATGSQPFTALTWFRTYPSDGRIQDLMSHGTNWALVLDGTTGNVVWDTQGAGPVLSASTFNDNNWHMAAGVYDGVNSTLYIDGEPNNSLPVTAPQAGDPNNPLFLGGNAAFALVGNNQQYFAGALAQAAFFTNALTATQIAQIYSVVSPVNTNPTKIGFFLSGGLLTLSWPTDHIGWTLQSQTDSVSTGLGAGWADVSGSTTTNKLVIPINPANGCVFYRLIYNQ